MINHRNQPSVKAGQLHVPDELVARQDNGLAVGLDMNARQVATSDGDIFVKPESKRLESRWHRYQRRLARQQKGSNRRNRTKRRAAKTARRLAARRVDWQHKATAALAGTYGTVAVEDLNTKGMTRNGGARKRGLNRVILDTGWRGIYEKLAYKAANVVRVNPRNTSRTCHACGHCAKSNRRSQAVFRCGSCGYEGNADVNAALNILALGTGAAGRGRGVGAAKATPTIRQIDSLALGLA